LQDEYANEDFELLNATHVIVFYDHTRHIKLVLSENYQTTMHILAPLHAARYHFIPVMKLPELKKICEDVMDYDGPYLNNLTLAVALSCLCGRHQPELSSLASTPRYGGVAKSLLALVGQKGGTAEADNAMIPSIDCLLGNTSTSKDDADTETDACSSNKTITDDDLLQLIRRNAFGPNFGTYQVMERNWNTNNTSNNNNTYWRPRRILFKRLKRQIVTLRDKCTLLIKKPLLD
jgi:hypothetical protein